MRKFAKRREGKAAVRSTHAEEVTPHEITYGADCFGADEA